ncbi:MAG: DUF2851 family protein [Bacteroidales bacterium]|nr:DUF2851 family protein [Bacteroidales bacterium]
MPCEEKVRKLDRFMVNYWLESLMVERLHQKSLDIEQTLQQTKTDWSETFYIHLLRNFGFKVNSDPFEMLARSLPLKYLARHKDNLTQLEALLFGQAGFLKDVTDDEYHSALKKEYTFLKAKFDLKPLEKLVWRFLRLRPGNFPTIRIAQLAMLIHKSSFLFSKIIETETLSDITSYFSIEASPYWKHHHHFGKKTSRKISGKIGAESTHNFMINTVSPFLFLYGRLNAKEDYKERAIVFLTDLPPEQNATIKNWDIAGIKADNAAQSQALLQLKKHYCDNKKCLNCMFGNKFISAIS